MGLKDVMRYLQQPGFITPVTPKKIMGLQHEANVDAGCTRVTPVTPHSGDTHEDAQLGTTGMASNDPKVPTAKPAPTTTKQTHQEWAQSWRTLADAYHTHHSACPSCIAAGKGYGFRCGAGAALWAAYDQAKPT